MNRIELVEALKKTAEVSKRTRGYVHLQEYFRIYFEEVVKDDHEFTGIIPYIPEYVVDAIEYLSEGKNLPSNIIQVRKRYLKEAELEQIPLLTEMYGNGVKRTLLVLGIADLFTAVTDSQYVKDSILGYCDAQDNVLLQSFFRFVKRVGKNGLFQIYTDSPCGCSGLIGGTEVRIMGTAGRLLVTFADNELEEQSITFIGDDDSPESPSWGRQSCYTSFQNAFKMIEDVIASWPNDPVLQKDFFKANEKIGIG